MSKDDELHESVSLPTALSSRSCSRPTVGEEHRRWMDGSSNSNYASNYILTSKCFEIRRQLLRSFTPRDVRRDYV